MDVKVHLNDIDDKTVIEKRMEFAFRVDGLDFWQVFFLCNDRHPDEKIIYLFTESQLKTLHDWLNNRAKKFGPYEIEKNLEFSSQNIFNTNRGPPKEYKKKEKMHFGYIKYRRGVPSIEAFRFAMSPPEEYMKDFFDEKFTKNLSNSQTEVNTPEGKVKELSKLRSKIAQKIFPPSGKKWLRYFGHRFKTKEENTFIEYCNEIDSNCPLVRAVFKAPAGPDKAAI